MEKELSAVDSIEALLIKLATELPSLVGEINSAGSALKQTNLRSLNSLSTAICDVPVNIAAELQLAAEAAESKHFFTCTQKLKNTSHQLQILMEEAKRTRRKIDFLAAPAGTTALEHHQPLHRQCAYLEQAVSLLYALNLGLHEVQLTANALYVHGLQDAAQPVLATDDLKDAIARLVSIVSTKHFKSTCTTIGSP
uniref:Uncharacterized protein n=1 Tax=Anopheles stephensi TaxID=30069 RepID=A0A182YCR4_ANOST